MSRKLFYTFMVAVAAAFSAGDISAQQTLGGSGHAGADRLSIQGYGGGFFSASSLGGGNTFDDTGILGGNVTFWATRYVGVRGSLAWSPPDVITQTADNVLTGEDPNVWNYSGDVVLRLPLPATQEVSFFPYILGGLGGKTYDFETLSTETDFAGNFGLGVEARFGENGRWGINTEVRDIVSSFDRFGADETLHDVIWTGGISLNF